LFEAGSGYSGAVPVGIDKKEDGFLNTSPTAGKWFRRFMRGMKLRMGEVKYQNEALTSKMVNGLSDMLEETWRAMGHEQQRERLEELMCYVLMSFGCGLRGEEVPLISLKGLLHFWNETRRDAEDPYIMLTLYGRFKGETGYRWHCLPICDHTRSSIPTRKWMSRLLHRRVYVQGRRTGFLLQKQDGRRVKISDYDGEFQDYMHQLHRRSPDLFSKGTLLSMFSLWRSPRRGATLETSGRVSETVVNLVNRWRKKEAAKGTAPGLTMQQTYTQVRDTVHLLREYSKAL
jgi:hypothetical protein